MATKATGTPDHVYDLILVVQQALEDCTRYQHCVDDARAAGDEELASWFEELAASDVEVAERGKALLRQRIGTGTHHDPAGG